MIGLKKRANIAAATSKEAALIPQFPHWVAKHRAPMGGTLPFARSALHGPRRTTSVAGAMPALWPTARSRWNATFAEAVPSKLLVAKYTWRLQRPLIAMPPSTTSSEHGRGLNIEDVFSVCVCVCVFFFSLVAVVSRLRSPPKKHWCCSVKGKGCEGAQPPAVDPGAGMVWKHVQVNGYWTWVAVTVSGGGAVVASLPYDCHVGLANWHIGWSAPKKTWCCANQKMGCEGAAGGGAAGGAGHFHTHTEVHVFHGGAAGGAAGGAGFPPGAAGQGMEWKWENDGGHWHWGQIHMEGSPKYDCHAGLAKFKTGWSTHKTAWCCHFEGLGCA